MHLICIATLILVGLQNPTPTPRKPTDTNQEKTHTTQQPAAANQRGTEDSPVFVKVVPTPKTKEEADRDTKEQENKTTNDRALVNFTGKLVVATFVLAGIGALQLVVFGYQAIMLKESVDTARESSEAYMRGERARVLMHKFDGYILTPANEGEKGPISCCGFSLMNYGKTPAKLTSFQAEIQIGSNKERPDDTSVYDDAEVNMVPSVVPQSGDIPQIAYFKDAKHVITVGELRDIQQTKKRFLWLCIRIRYEDIFRSEPVHETRLCYLFEPDTLSKATFSLAGPAEYHIAT
jgi:hypothetical protein